MTHCNDDGIQIKVEPISPLEVAGAHEVPLDSCRAPISSTYLEAAPLMRGSQAPWQRTPDRTVCTLRPGIKEEREEVLRTSSCTRKALKNKIQSGRRARGQDELVVKFEPETKSELTETEIKKRERRKEQNRRAAQKCRIKKRQLQSIALQEYTSLLQQHDELQNETKNLKLEVSRLKGLLQEHENSGLCKLVRPPQNQSTLHHTHCNKLAITTTASASLNHSFSQPNGSNPEALRRSEELKKQASIQRIVKDLEGITPQAQEPPLEQPVELEADMTLPEVMMNLEDIAEYLESVDNGSPCMDTNDFVMKDTASNNFLKGSEGQFWADDLSSILVAPNNKQCAVRNLNEEFARCGNQDLPSNHETISPSPTIDQFCTHQHQQLQQQQQTTVSPNSSNSLPTPLNLEELPNHGLLHTLPSYGGSYFLSNELSPVSSYSSCTSPPSNLTSPSLFHSPAERHRCSPDTPQVPSIFRFPPDARFSPSS